MLDLISSTAKSLPTYFQLSDWKLSQLPRRFSLFISQKQYAQSLVPLLAACLPGGRKRTGEGSYVQNNCYAKALVPFFCLLGLGMFWPLMASGPALAASAEDSVLKIKAEHGPTQQTGTAFYVRPNILATSYHLIQGAEIISVQVGEARIQITSVLAYDPDLDLALLYMPLRGTALPLDNDTPRPWTSLESLGFAQGESLQKVSVLFRNLEKIDGVWHLSFQGPIQPGMSGGPVLNPQGRVVGMNRFVSARDHFFSPQAMEVQALRQALDLALASPEFIDVSSFARQTSIQPKLNIEDQHIVITDN
ncbi:MAG: serine protease [Desulfovermiculus sp.]